MARVSALLAASLLGSCAAFAPTSTPALLKLNALPGRNSILANPALAPASSRRPGRASGSLSLRAAAADSTDAVLAALQKGDVAALQAATVGHEAQVAAAGVSLVLLLSFLSSAVGGDKPATPYPNNNQYDYRTAEEYFAACPALVASRTAELLLKSGSFGLSLLLDQITGKIEENMPKRASALTTLLTQLGPTFIKIGQSLSIRTDLMPPTYVRALQQLQDQVPAFPTDQALKTIEEELGAPANSLFSGIAGAEPIAAASLGQVYKATIASGENKGVSVAVKVQRPEITEKVALDMYLIRKACPLFKLATEYPGDAEGLVDDWGVGFVNELNYQEEAVNGGFFNEAIRDTPLRDVVFAPDVVDELSSRKILTTEWVEGERLEKSNAKDVSGLCSIAMNSYLTMMLETGKLHCDPHPGNLLRTPAGKLCILDWGLVQTLPADLRLSFIEHIAHLTAADYEKVPSDLVKLGFVPEGKEGEIVKTDAVEVLSSVYTQLAGGGGAKKIDVNAVVNEMSGLTEQYGQIFQVPPYFAYIGRAFSVLEGIGLTNDPDYSIIGECLPYVSQRLLSDPSPRTAGALNTFIFGVDKEREDRLLDVGRVETLLEGYSSYAAAAGGAGLVEAMSVEERVEEVADKILELVFSKDNTPLQSIVLEQVAKVTAAGTRKVWADARQRSGLASDGRSLLGRVVDPLGLFQRSKLVVTSEEDERALEATQRLVSVLRQASYGDQLARMTQQEIRSVASIIARKVWERRRELVITSNRFGLELLKQTADRLDRQPSPATAQRLEASSSEA
uniref:ABC1 atypical kinase-like domain-containing protein n=2 Tax=Hemiselmis andersenii TaxID=464988 RepID=A0A6U2CV00_HEMAN|mmetsp:Transcript_16821/g.38817  ORF Transcript_16821/g.38817 Transcript_16821/m.38817 type:complete len:793 (+) Transcript_16821:59-2437(+)